MWHDSKPPSYETTMPTRSPEEWLELYLILVGDVMNNRTGPCYFVSGGNPLAQPFLNAAHADVGVDAFAQAWLVELNRRKQWDE
jgi:hypothetical protein